VIPDGATEEMSMAFTEEEAGYMKSQRLARIATVGAAPYMRITPTVSWSWNLDGRPFSHDNDDNEFGPRRTVHG
jgi:pyridoxamine 5'-phosphate oxidase family protein